MAAANINDDIIFLHILPKIPAKSLMRFKCVSKLWKSTITSDPNFRLSQKHRTRALFINLNRSKMCKSLKGVISLPDPREFIFEDLPVPPPYSDPDEYQSLLTLGSCNGLILFTIYGLSGDIFLWNPSTSDCRKVLELDRFQGVNELRVTPGFCYDPLGDDYIVLLALGYSSPSHGWLISTTLKSKNWRHVPFAYNVSHLRGGTVVNNHLHWIISSNDPNTLDTMDNCYYNAWSSEVQTNDTILYFDVPSSTFKLFPMPDPVNGIRDEIVGLGVVNECLCMTRKGHISGDFELLVMKEYGVKESWTKMFYIPDVEKYQKWGLYDMELLLSTEKQDVLFFNIWSEIYAFYVSDNRMEKFRVPDFHEQKYYMCAIPFVETIISPNSYTWDDERDQKLNNSSDYSFWHN